MKTVLFSFLIFINVSLKAQYSVEWAKIYGGRQWDEANQVIETFDKGLLLVGFTKSDTIYDLRIMKLNADGALEWDKTINTNPTLRAECVTETNDHGFVIAGQSFQKGYFTSDMHLLKLNYLGDIEWEKRYGDSYNDCANSIIETYDGGLAVAGYTESANHDPNCWIVKFNSEGKKLWDQEYGGSKPDFANDIAQATNNDLLIAGWTSSMGQAERAAYVIRLDPQGEWIFDETFKTSNWNVASAITATADNGMAVSAYYKADGVINFDLWVFKLDEFANIIWQKSLGNKNWDESTDIIQTSDKGIVMAAFTYSKFDEKSDFWIMKFHKDGYLIWDQVFQRSSLDYTRSICETVDKNLVITGTTFTGNMMNWEFALLKLRNENIHQIDAPQIQFLQPKLHTTVDTPFYELKICFRSKSELQSAVFFANDLMHTDILADTLHHVFTDTLYTESDTLYNSDLKCALIYEKTIELEEGSNKIEVIAKNKAGTAYSELRKIFYLYEGKKRKGLK